MPSKFPWSKSSKPSSTEQRDNNSRAESRQAGNYDSSAPRQLFSPEPYEHQIDHHSQLRRSSTDEDPIEPDYRYETQQQGPAHGFDQSPSSPIADNTRQHEGKKSVRAIFGLRNKSREGLQEEEPGHRHFFSKLRVDDQGQQPSPYNYTEEGTLPSISSDHLAVRGRQSSQDPSILDDRSLQGESFHTADFEDSEPLESPDSRLNHHHTASKPSVSQYQPYSSQNPQFIHEEPPSYVTGDPTHRLNPYTPQSYHSQLSVETSQSQQGFIGEGDVKGTGISPEIPQGQLKRNTSLLRKQVPSGSSYSQRTKGVSQGQSLEVNEFLGMPGKSNSLSSAHSQRSPTHGGPPPPSATSLRSPQGPGNTLQKPVTSQEAEYGRRTPPSVQTDSDMPDQDNDQLLRDYRELRDKYSKVKRYYFEKEAQVTQLQNALAHQKLSQSRTSLDDGEYVGRLTRLDGLIAQLAFGFRKDWKNVPGWLQPFVNKDALSIGKQEMTAVGRAFISHWIVEEVFSKYFHPGLEPEVSSALQTVQRSLRLNAPALSTDEEEAALTDKILTWRMSTMEGLHHTLSGNDASARRQSFVEMLNVQLISALHEHMQDPPPAGLEGGVNMIIELVVTMLNHLPAESRDVQIDYYLPGTVLSSELMKVETGVPALTDPMADLPEFDKKSLEINISDATTTTSDSTTQDTEAGSTQDQPKKGVPTTGAKKASNSAGATEPSKAASAAASQNSLVQPPGSAGGDATGGRVRFAVLPALQIRGKMVLSKAPVYKI